MKRQTFTRRTRIEQSADVVFAWHERPRAFLRLIPPWQNVRIEKRPRRLSGGERAIIKVSVGPFTVTWVAEHVDYVPGRQFRDIQRTGPFAAWDHLHRVTPIESPQTSQAAGGGEACHLEDRITYALPYGAIGRIFGSRRVRRELNRLFAYRHRITEDDIMQHATAADSETLTIAVTGSTGLVGTALCDFLDGGGHEIVRLLRPGSKVDRDGGRAIEWDPSENRLSPSDLEGVDAVIHLAGDNIAAGRWTESKRRSIRDSRVKSTQLLADVIARLDHKPKVFLCASAIGYYGDRGDESLTEDSAAGTGFLADVCKAWEAACDPVREAGIRTVNHRIGMVLSPKGGAIEKMLTPFKLGAGGVVGPGTQYWSWITLDDLVGTIHHAIFHPELAGPINATSPNPATNREFTKTLGQVLGRPTVFPLPGPIARIMLGEMADALLLSSARVMPTRLLEHGYRFRHPVLEDALRTILGR